MVNSQSQISQYRMKGGFDTLKFFCPVWIVFAYDYHFFIFQDTLQGSIRLAAQRLVSTVTTCVTPFTG